MMGKTHLAFGLLAGLFGISYFHPNNQLLFILLVAIASIFPDIDLPDSTIGRMLKPVSRPLNFLFEHRGFFHGIFAAAIFAALIFLISRSRIYAYAVALGYISHMAIDALTYSGIMPLHPLSRRKLRGFLRTGEIEDFALFLLFVGFGIWKLLHI